MRKSLDVRHVGVWLVLALVVLMGGCTERSESPDASGRPAVSSFEVGAQELSAVVADSEIRMGIFRALQRSPYSEHKISFQEFVLTPEARPLLGRLAAVHGTTVGDVISAVLGSAALDLYLPGETHRIHWSGLETPGVADAREYQNGRLTVWQDGAELAVIDPRHSSTTVPLLLIARSEVRAYRIGLYGERPNATVQGPTESQEGGLVIRTGRDGGRDTIQLAELTRNGRDPNVQLAQACPDDHPEWCVGGGDAGSGGTGQDDPVWQTLGTTYLTQIGAQGVCDNNLCALGDDNEFEFTGYWRYGNVEESNTIRRTGVPTSGAITGLHLWLLNRVPTLQAPIAVTLIETDAVSDDHFGTIYLADENKNRNVVWFQAYPNVAPYAWAQFTW